MDAVDLFRDCLGEIVTLRVEIKFEMPRKIELVVDVRKMIAQRVFAHIQQVGDLAMRRAGHAADRGYDFALPFGQSGDLRRFGVGSIIVGKRAENARCGCAIEPYFAGMHFLY